jgi:hypothetical protein
MTTRHEYFLRIAGRFDPSPLSLEQVFEMIDQGRLGPDDSILGKGTTQERRVGDVPRLAERLEKRRREHLDPLGLDELGDPDSGPVVGERMSASSRSSAARTSPSILRKVHVPSTVALSIVTLGVFWIAWFHSTALKYRRIADPGGPSLHGRMWAWIGILIACVLYGPFIPILWPFQIIAGAIYLNTTLRYRERILEPQRLPKRVSSRMLLVCLWCTAASLPVVGLVAAAFSSGLRLQSDRFEQIATALAVLGPFFLLFQFVTIFMRDHNRIVSAVSSDH